MRIIAVLVLIIGVGLAGGAIYFAYNYFQAYEAELARKAKNVPKLIPVMVAKERLEYGMRLEGNRHIAILKYPENIVPEGAFTDYNDMISGADGDRPRLLRTVDKHSPILRTMISGFDEEGRMAMNLADGKRAFSIRIDALSGVAGFIAPGDRVDVMLTRSAQGTLESNIIMQNLLVIAVDQATNSETTKARVGNTATVEVTTTEAQKLALAQQIGRLTLTLRGVEEMETSDSPQKVNVRDLLGEPEVEKRTGTQVRVRKGGGDVQSVTVD